MSKIQKLSDLKTQFRNANKHTSFGLRLLEKSLREDGFIDAQTATADGEIISGSARLEKAVEFFSDKDGEDVEPIIVHSDGSRPVIVIRDDIPNAETARARRLSVAANAIAKADFNPDGELLNEWAGEDDAIRELFSDDEWGEIVNGEEFDDAEKLKEKNIEIKPKKYLHILLSVDLKKSVDEILEIREMVEEIGKNNCVEVLYGSN
jgi:hypothetical protein